MGIGQFWRRYLGTGEYLVTCEPELFPSVVMLLEALAHPDETGASELRQFVQAALDCVLPRSAAADNPVLSAAQIADVLILVDPTFVDVPDLEREIDTFSDDERAVAMEWARVYSAAMFEHIERRPAIPPCVGRLYSSLLSTAQERDVDVDADPDGQEGATWPA